MKSLLPKPTAFQDIWPKRWKDSMDMENTDILQFRNLAHWKSYCGKGKQLADMKCGISYKQATKNMLANKATLTEESEVYKEVYRKTKTLLIKRRLIADTIYETDSKYKYTVDGVS